jgi:hypothetical protein
MIGFGSFGGFSYPTRRAFGNAQPDSQVVESVPSNWMDDWNRRYAEESAKAGQGASAGSWLDKSAFDPFEYARMIYDPTVQTRDNAEFVPEHLRGGVQSTEGMKEIYVPGGGGGYVPDFTALNAERDKMLAMYENQTRQQQAYDTVLGGDGYIGGVMNERYTNPTAGQITGRTAGFGGMGGFGSTMPPDIKTMGSGQPGTMSAPQAQAGGVMGQGGSDLTGIAPDTMGLYSGGSGIYRPQDTGMTAIPRNDLGMGFGY